MPIIANSATGITMYIPEAIFETGAFFIVFPSPSNAR